MKAIIYEDKGGDYRWKMVSKNGRIVATSGEGYANKGNARRALYSFLSILSDGQAKVHEE